VHGNRSPNSERSGTDPRTENARTGARWSLFEHDLDGRLALVVAGAHHPAVGAGVGNRQYVAFLAVGEQAFGAEERFRMDIEEGRIGHAEVRIGDSVVMLAEAGGEWSHTPGNLHLYVEDCDAMYDRALAAGATSVREMADQFYGDRSGGVRDPSGNMWWITTHIEDVAPDEMERRSAEWKAQQKA
jgi:PhnB protein